MKTEAVFQSPYGHSRTLQKSSHLGGGWEVQFFLLERGVNLKRGVATFYYFTVQLHLHSLTITFTVCVEKIRFTLLLFRLSVF